ncbi:hypothetical protein N9L68_00770 [bacterium]|nr:hypothetical protein [bacterium]
MSRGRDRSRSQHSRRPGSAGSSAQESSRSVRLRPADEGNAKAVGRAANEASSKGIQRPDVNVPSKARCGEEFGKEERGPRKPGLRSLEKFAQPKRERRERERMERVASRQQVLHVAAAHSRNASLTSRSSRESGGRASRKVLGAGRDRESQDGSRSKQAAATARPAAEASEASFAVSGAGATTF